MLFYRTYTEKLQTNTPVHLKMISSSQNEVSLFLENNLLLVLLRQKFTNVKKFKLYNLLAFKSIRASQLVSDLIKLSTK